MGSCCSSNHALTNVALNTSSAGKYGSSATQTGKSPNSNKIKEKAAKSPKSNKIKGKEVACLSRECAVPLDFASLALKQNSSVLDAIVHVLENRGDSNQLLPPLAALAIQKEGERSIRLASSNMAIDLLCHRVVGDLGAADQLVHELFASANTYKADPKPREIPAESFECDVCYDVTTPQNATKLAHCSHQFCTVCVRGHIDNCLRTPGNSPLNVRCVDPDCAAVISEHEVRLLASPDALQAAIVAAIDDFVATDHCLRRCQTAGCNHVFHFCPVRQQSSCNVCPECNQAPMESSMAALIEEERALLSIIKKHQVRQCARCGSGVQKSSGCNKLKCRCGFRFCYVCGKENAQCGHTPASHGFINNVSGYAEFSDLRDTISPDASVNRDKFNDGRPRCPKNHHLQLNKKGTPAKTCKLCAQKKRDYYSCLGGCKNYHVCADCYHK